jgi:hypothetical protein
MGESGGRCQHCDGSGAGRVAGISGRGVEVALWHRFSVFGEGSALRCLWGVCGCDGFDCTARVCVGMMMPCAQVLYSPWRWVSPVAT